MSLGFEEVLSKSSVINSSLSIEEESSYIQEQVSQVLGQTKLAYDYKRQINEDSEDEVNLFLCKQDTLNTQLSNNGINIDVVGWMLTDLYILSQELLTKANLTAHYFVDISQKRILVVSCNARLESASFELDSNNLAQQIQALCLADITSMLLYGDEANIALFKNQTRAVKGISFIDARSLMPVEHNGSFSSLYPALACALGAMYWSESI
ncbi:hypothetical protein A9264_03695 [Vibrio sp. UCD-FRSSP16_10]|nr:hypothetical protein [Vibrio sp. UCD-FRSSP16_10]OBT10074.1 hypothetical protein A9260_05145 [Vibrio sp. UCD-FRSSP16_30]OBT18864.1 hypothetical protein A9264_03695 [Vibrio sp. UCD-FRSSP16_10]